MATKIGAFAYLECSARTKEGVQQVVDGSHNYDDSYEEYVNHMM